ncbi:DUF2064 domain-containing protein [Allobranchiibius sp. GilTou38]|uniref:TIGR04282 family arsenosugar biosynthesis glycosyltransferase n=1 Tax=Allobranchiibius sp. GilTou38 TaxID=2815210 RepID=UPI001AA16F69|nr:DUF2064 domain-containing protein [Allobranchiibius sp. GilTou38]MBO1767774.1 DUF2064 domain-containing protein [Allobranchiibius sp. GilTou38]
MTITLASVMVIAKEPVAGRVKTRLTVAITPEQAAAVAAAAIRDTLDAMSMVPAHRHVLALDGKAGEWVPAGWSVVAQPEGGLDRRLATVIGGLPPGPCLLVGMDTPQVTPSMCGFDPNSYDACLGMATDGGYWAIGFADPAMAPEVIEGVPMSTDHTGADQLARMLHAGLRVQELAPLLDVDTPEDAAQVAALVPASAFAGAWTTAMAATAAGADV